VFPGKKSVVSLGVRVTLFCVGGSLFNVEETHKLGDICCVYTSEGCVPH
jgi:hypothetical protein